MSVYIDLLDSLARIYSYKNCSARSTEALEAELSPLESQRFEYVQLSCVCLTIEAYINEFQGKEREARSAALEAAVLSDLAYRACSVSELTPWFKNLRDTMGQWFNCYMKRLDGYPQYSELEHKAVGRLWQEIKSPETAQASVGNALVSSDYNKVGLLLDDFLGLRYDGLREAVYKERLQLESATVYQFERTINIFLRLATCKGLMGADDQAISYATNAVVISRDLLPIIRSTHQSIFAALIDSSTLLCQLYVTTGRKADARVLMRDMTTVLNRKETTGIADASILGSIALGWFSVGNMTRAEHYARLAISRYEREQVRELAPIGAYIVIIDLAMRKGDCGKACNYLHELEKSRMDKVTPAMSIGLASYYYRLGDYAQCYTKLQQFMPYVSKSVQVDLPMVSSTNLRNYAAATRRGTYMLLLLHAKRHGAGNITEEACRQSLLAKELLVAGFRMLGTRSLRSSRSSEITARYVELARMERQHSALIYAADPDSLRKCRDLESDILGKESGLRSRLRGIKINLSFVDQAQIRKSLHRDERYLDFVKTNYRECDDELGKADRYYCFIISPDRRAPVLIDLGEAKHIDVAVHNLRNSILSCADKLNCEQNLSVSDKAAVDSASILLTKLVWAKLKPHMAGARRVYVSADGELNLLPFGALKDDKTVRYLVQDYIFNYIACPSDVVGARTSCGNDGSTVVFAAPSFDEKTQTVQVERDVHANTISRTMDPGRILRKLRPLTLTKQTATEIADSDRSFWHWNKGRVYSGRDATEANLLKVKSPRNLILLTHGFYLPNGNWGRSRFASGLMLLPASMKAMSPENVLPLENPMNRSVICLAGASDTLCGKRAGQDNDGLMTAEEFSTLDLSGTELVVLGACQTGVGDVNSGFGVAGLRSAVRMAGARRLVCSLWSVPEEETCRLLADFFRRYRNSGDAAAALTEAQRAMISGGKANPLFWAGFVADGLR